jgi:hypothetical protein
MMRELNAAWSSLFQDVMECVPDDRKVEFISRAYKLLQAGEYLEGKEAEAKLNNLTKGELA